MMQRRGMKLLTVVGMLVATAARADPSPPVFPQQFTASITIEAHHCDKTKEYPPCMKYLQVHYDYPARKAKILFEHTKRVKVSRYDEGKEYLVSVILNKTTCRKSKMREKMPLAAMPTENVRFVETKQFGGGGSSAGTVVNHWVEDLSSLQVHYYEDATTRQPLQLQVQTVESDTVTVPDVTYTVTQYAAGAPAAGVYEENLVQFDGEEQDHKYRGCERVPMDMGFPYIHFFHHWFRI